jgi:hypothetical protein
MAMGATSNEAAAHIVETWPEIQDDTRDGQGSSYYYWYYLCNFDTNADPIILP